MTWNPDQYLKFAQPRLRPALDLLQRIALAAPAALADLGCGTGSITRLLAERWPRARVLGVDSAASMLARGDAGAERITWQQADLAHWAAPQPMDLVYSNAALHWLPDHAALFPRLMGMLARGGLLAVQMPRNFDAPSHTGIADTVRDGPWRATLEPMLRPSPVAAPAWYHGVLSPHAQDIDIWETEYLQVLQGEDPVKEWTKGTWLAPFLAALPPGQREDFEAAYAARMREAYPRQADGRTLFPFKRLFILATAAGAG
jgi:trans-aconitate 2-methyltransferase